MPFTNAGLLLIKSEIATDPDAVGYLGKTDAQVAGLLNLPRPQAATQRAVPPGPVMFYLVRAGKWNTLLTALSQSAKDFADYLRNRMEPLDATQLGMILDALVTATVLTAADKAAILAFGQTPSQLSRLQILFDATVGVIEAGDVAAARMAV